jgi:hypothetical protein
VSARGWSIAVYVVLGLGVLAAELLGRREGSTVPTFGRLVRHAMRRRPGQLAVVLAWWWVGWHFLR